MVQQVAKTRKSSKTKAVTIIARYFIKRNGAVVYLVRSSNGVDTYHTTIIRGKATGCDCPSYKPCKHMVQCEQLERERAERIASQAEQVNERKLAEHRANDTYELTAAQKQAALDEERNRYNRVALALGW